VSSPGKAETPLVAKYHDLLAWLAPALEKLPKAQRFLLASRLLDTAFACHAELIRARKMTDIARAQALLEADIHLETLRLQWRLAHELKCISTGQYEHGARLMDEIGRLLGAWRR
jgi:hypothetical protein